jgi:hypothetical protein
VTEYAVSFSGHVLYVHEGACFFFPLRCMRSRVMACVSVAVSAMHVFSLCFKCARVCSRVSSLHCVSFFFFGPRFVCHRKADITHVTSSQLWHISILLLLRNPTWYSEAHITCILMNAWWKSNLVCNPHIVTMVPKKPTRDTRCAQIHTYIHARMHYSHKAVSITFWHATPKKSLKSNGLYF